MTNYISEIERFLSKIDKSNSPDGCWIWTAQRAGWKNKYGRFWVQHDKAIRAHRYSFQHFCGDIPHGFEVCHKCDNMLCVNPDHLYLGTHQENVQDCVRKGRSGLAKLTPEQVLDIRQKRKSGISAKSLSEEYGVSDRQIRNIVAQGHWVGLQKY